MVDRNRVLKQEEKMKKFKIASINPIREHDLYVSEVFEVVKRLCLENPNCFNKDIINYKMGLSNRLLKKYGREINNYYHYTLKENKKIIGIRYKNSGDDLCNVMFEYLKYKVILQVVIYEADNDYFSELKSLVSYDRVTGEIKIINICFSETLNDEKYVYCWSGNNKKETNKVFTKRISDYNKKR